MTVLLSNGDGTFTQAAGSPIAVGQNAYSAATADFNSDGKADLAVASQFANTLTILMGSGTGNFTQASGSPITVGYSPNSVAVGDFNGDGKPDIAVVNQCGSDSSCGSPGNVMIFQGSGTGTFTQASHSPLTIGSYPGFVIVGDLNGDGISDLAAANNGGGTVSVYVTRLTQSARATATGINPTGTGTHNVDASYPGDTIHKASTSATTPLL